MPSLFDPLDIGPRRAKNRIFRAATGTKLGKANAVSDELLAHYQTVARGGAGTVVTEALRFHPSALNSPGGIAAFRAESVPGLSRWADTVHEAGALIVGQLNHSGRQHTSHKVPGGLIGPSAVACPRSGGVPRPMSVADIEEFVDSFGIAAGRLAEAGFDGVEVHCAQGHLLQQFLSPFSNRRDDAYGGSDEKRARFPGDVARRVRESTGSDFVVGLRLGIDEFTEGGLTLDLAIKFAESVVGEGWIDYLSLSQGNFNTIDTHLPDRHYPHLPFIDQHATVKRAISQVPVVACTRIVTPDEASHIVESGIADAVALSRALIVDPEWPNKAASGKSETIRFCIGCNECWDGLHEGTSTISCVQNATAGREFALGPIVPTTTKKKVVVIGGGPAGLETARVAAERGHRVTLLEGLDRVGGKITAGAAIANHVDLNNVIRFLDPAARAAGVSIRTGVMATVEIVNELEPDVIVVATGATPMPGELQGDESIANHSGLPDLPPDLSGRNMVVVDEDGHYWAAQVAEDLVDRGAEVVVVTRFFEPLRELPSVSRIAALRRLDGAGVRFLPLHSLTRADASDLHVKHFESGRATVLAGVSDVVWVGPQRPNNELAISFKQLGMTGVRIIGDALAPRRVKHAIAEGHAAGRAV